MKSRPLLDITIHARFRHMFTHFLQVASFTVCARYHTANQCDCQYYLVSFSYIKT